MQILNCTINRLHPILVHQNINATPCFWTSKISFQLIFANLALVFTCSSTPETVWHLVARETKFTIKKNTPFNYIYKKRKKPGKTGSASDWSGNKDSGGAVVFVWRGRNSQLPPETCISSLRSSTLVDVFHWWHNRDELFLTGFYSLKK